MLGFLPSSFLLKIKAAEIVPSGRREKLCVLLPCLLTTSLDRSVSYGLYDEVPESDAHSGRGRLYDCIW